MKKVLIISILLISSIQFGMLAQTNSKFEKGLESAILENKQEYTVWIYFTDKG